MASNDTLRYYARMYSEDISGLPILDVLDELRQRLEEGDEAVLQAPPGAGKTTVVPLELMRESWLEQRKVLILEPRRVAARAAAHRMASLLGEDVGETVGYRIRLETCAGERTRVEVITEGILTRLLQTDPGLEDVGLLIFDEFHERNLDSDLCLALSLLGRVAYREAGPLKILVMSATLDGDAVARLVDNAPVVTSQGRQFPVQTHYGKPHQLRDSIVAPTSQTILRALRERQGSILVFLPGQREIKRVARELAVVLRQQGEQQVELAPLYGGLSLEEQQRAIAPAAKGMRKIVLATNIAETSLTIEGISTVVDAGLVREAVFDPATGMTRLATRRISRASAEQRAGRAGRVGPGYCYRVWSEEQHKRLVAHATPEILQADLAPMVLQLLSWGIDDCSELAWLDSPPAAPFDQALSLLEGCGAAFSNAPGRYQLTPHGVRLAQMPLHPRLAHMLLVGCDVHAMETACLVAALLSERNPMDERGVDIAEPLSVLLGESRCLPQLQGWFQWTWRQARVFARLASEVHKPRRYAIDVAQTDMLGVLIATAYPDRIARLRPDGDGSQYQLSNGRSAVLPAQDSLVGSPWLSVAELGGHVGESSDRIYRASALNPEYFTEILSNVVREEDHVDWNYRDSKFVAQRHRQVGAILLGSEPLQHIPQEAATRAILGVVRKNGLDMLPWTSHLRQWRARIMLLHEAEIEMGEQRWPDLSDESLMDSLEEWLAPYVNEVRRLQDFQDLDLKTILSSRLPWPLPLELERLAPERLPVPSGSSIAIDYTRQPPVLAVKLQEMFGCEVTPSVADGRIALQVHLLSPAGRPLQVTQDLAGFWRTGYHEVKRDMKGRYPKHPWPDDPLDAKATRHTRKRAQGG